MKLWLGLLLCCGYLLISTAKAQQWQVASPNGEINLQLELTADALQYQVQFQQQPVIKASKLGLAFKNQANLQSNLQVTDVVERHQDQSWQPLWGQRSTIRDNFREITLSLRETGDKVRQLQLIFRVYNEGVAFRYKVPAQAELQHVVISDELTEFNFAQNYAAWWQQAYQPQSYEYQYLNSALSSVNVAHTPLTLTDDGIAIAIHEAALVDYAAMTLRHKGENLIQFTADLVPWSNGDKVRTQTPFQSPWRTIQIAKNAVALLNSDLILNLNEPANAKIDTSYIKPGKYMGIWWEMHIGLKDWSPGPKQGATTARAKQYIDFASQHDIDGVLIEGWNQGWEGDWWQRPPTFSFTKPVKGLDMTEVAQYAKNKGVQIIGHHETAAGVAYYEAQMAAGMGYYQKLGIHSVKMGYVGPLLDQKEWHDGQFMVNHFQKVVDTAAAHGLMVNAHETVKDTGLSRTNPNLMTRESVRGMEYNGGSPDTGNSPNHTVIIPFTRGLAGPTDFTPGIFNFNYQKYRPNNRVPSTLANQLSLYVTLYSPLQMVADLPEHYQDSQGKLHPAFAFIDEVPTDWQQSIALQGEIGEFLVVARQDKHSERWYVGASNNQTARKLEVSLNFLPANTRYQLTLYADAADAHWRTNPSAYQITSQEVTANSLVSLTLAAGGGAAMALVPLQNQQ